MVMGPELLFRDTAGDDAPLRGLGPWILAASWEGGAGVSGLLAPRGREGYKEIFLKMVPGFGLDLVGTSLQHLV